MVNMMKSAQFYARINPSNPNLWIIYSHNITGKDPQVGEIRYESVVSPEGTPGYKWLAKMHFVTEEGDTPQKALKALVERYNRIYQTNWSVQ